MAWLGEAWQGRARQGKGHSVGVLRIVSAAGECYGLAGRGLAGRGVAWQGSARVLRHMVAVPQLGKARRGWGSHGRARSGIARGFIFKH